MKHPGVVYAGRRRIGPQGEALGHEVTVNGRRLDPLPSLRVRSHSPSGFEWGYPGGGPNQLALALLLDVLEDRERVLRCYQWFKWAVVQGWGHSWRLTAGEVLKWVERFEAEQAAEQAAEAGDDRLLTEHPPVVMPSADVVTRKGGA